METSHQPTSRGLPRPIRGLLVNQAPRTQTIGHSLVHRSQALEPLLKPGVVVPEDIIIYGPIKLINTGEVHAAVHFGLQMTEEVLSSPRCR
ncbi:hypothetical protein, partial [Corynebacterium diphtheriae]|uniref:hypothetical protein n=1 Tax=Corynebacterium diphtheriae TaxID=1717 RepID=UPI003C12C6F7